MLNRTMNDEWDRLAKTVLHNYHPAILNEAKTIFMAGGYAMSTLMVVRTATVSEEEGIDACRELAEECITQFKTHVGFAESDGGEPD